MKLARIVIIDDDEDILDLLSYNLEKEKADVITFTSGLNALLHIRRQTPDLIICDWMMDDIDGLDICRLLKRDAALIHVPFVMLTARGDEIDAVTALELGADEYLTKPVRMRELITRLKKLLGRHQHHLPVLAHQNASEGVAQGAAPAENTLRFGELSLNIDSYTVLLEKRLLELTYTEFKLLQLLISKPGRVYTRNQIMEKINGLDYFATERSIDVQVAGLRKKLGVHSHYIETVRGVGYRMQE